MLEFQASSYTFALLLCTVAYSFYAPIRPYSATLIFDFIGGADLAYVLDSAAVSGAGLDHVLDSAAVSGAGLDHVLDSAVIGGANLIIVACVYSVGGAIQTML